VQAVLELSTKYDIQYLRSRAISHLATIYPSTLEAWDRREAVQPFWPHASTAFRVLRLAKKLDIPILLPAVMYDCSTGDLGAIFTGYGYRGNNCVTLDRRDQKTCIMARIQLGEAKRNRVWAFLKTLDEQDCTGEDNECERGRLEYWSTYMDEVVDPIDIDVDWDSYGAYVCASCVTEAKSSYEAARLALWEDLPSFFKLQKWTQLRAC
jgi:hypothetical protein